MRLPLVIFLAAPQIRLRNHIGRAQFFLASSSHASDARVTNWLLLSAVYSARAPIEIMVTEIKISRLRGNYEDLLTQAAAEIRRFKVIETLRVQDFHRRAVILRPNFTSFSGPMKISTGGKPGSGVALKFDCERGLTEKKLGSGHAAYNRPLVVSGFSVFDDATDAFVVLAQALEEYIEDAKIFIRKYYPTIRWV